MPDHELKETVVVITGASSGFGRGAARRFAEEGASVVLAARRDQVLDEAVRECQAAGAGAIGRYEDVPLADHVRVIETDLLGTLFGLSASLRQELQQEGVNAIHVCTVMPTTFDTPFFEHAAQYTGREASPIPPTYDPKDVVDVIVPLATNPEDEVSVGSAAKAANFMHHLFSGLVERMMARQTHKAEFQNAGAGEKTSGSLHEPMPTGTEVAGGWKK